MGSPLSSTFLRFARAARPAVVFCTVALGSSCSSDPPAAEAPKPPLLPGEHCDPDNRPELRLTFDPPTIVVAPGRTRPVRLVVEPDQCLPSEATFTSSNEGVAAARPRDPVFIAGSIAPLEDCYRPERTPDATTLRVEHAVHVGSLIAAGATLGWIETMPTLREAVTALEAARAGALPAVVSFVLGPDGRLLDGERLGVAAREVAALQPLAILVNCCPVDVATRALDELAEASEVAIGAYANGRGSPTKDGGWGWRGGTSDRAYAAEASTWPTHGARLVGGCCGTSPRTIAKLARRLRKAAAKTPSRSAPP